MKKTTIFLLTALLAIGLGTLAYGTTSSTLSVSDSHNVSVTVSSTHKILLGGSGTEVATFNSANAGALTPSGTGQTALSADTLDYATNDSGTGLKITVASSSALPTGISLGVWTSSPSTLGTAAATSSPGVSISSSASDLITSIASAGEETEMTINYEASANWNASVQSGTSITVNYELTTA